MTTQQPAALWIAYELEIGTFVPNVLQNEIVLRQNAAAELRRQHARITELEAQLAQRFDAADMATASAQGFRDGVASVRAGIETVSAEEAAEQFIQAAIDHAPETFRRLGDFLSRVLDEDQWASAQRLLLSGLVSVQEGRDIQGDIDHYNETMG